jgi:hypothetical protein
MLVKHLQQKRERERERESRIVAGVNTGWYEAYRKMLARGFQSDILGIAMQRYNDSGYNKHNVYVIDYWC